jgi:hypothetical protein
VKPRQNTTALIIFCDTITWAYKKMEDNGGLVAGSIIY